jgi:hypothetical protein
MAESDAFVKGRQLRRQLMGEGYVDRTLIAQ